MNLPESALDCLRALEEAGYEAYAVGGCVRDSLLGQTPKDWDLCTAALPRETMAVFSSFPLVTAGVKHGTVGVVTTEGVVEITTFRREGDYGDHRHPEWVEFVPSLLEDLARRDFTVNAMACSPKTGVVDPYGGKEDLDRRILRAVGDPEIRFREDALRILRGIRFAARYGLTPEEKTLEKMLALAPLCGELSRERVFAELSEILLLADRDTLLRYHPVFSAVIPELGPTVGFDQRSPHHAYDLFTHIAYVTQAVPREPVLRWAALLHDVGKIPAFTQDETGRGHFYRHAQIGAEMADGILRRLTAPNALREEAVTLIANHMTPLEDNRKQLRRFLAKLGEGTLRNLLALQEADMSSKGIPHEDYRQRFREIRQVLEEILSEESCLSLRSLAVNGNDMLALGLEGPEIGRCLNRLLSLVVDETVPNEREALLEAAKAYCHDSRSAQP